MQATASKTNTKVIDMRAKASADAKDATKRNAIELGRIHFALCENTRQFNRAKKAHSMDPINGGEAFADATAKFGATAAKLAVGILAIPAGTTAKGGGNRQSVWCEHFAMVNRDLKIRMSKSDAKEANKNSWTAV